MIQTKLTFVDNRSQTRYKKFQFLAQWIITLDLGDEVCGAGEIHTRARKISRRRDARGAPKIFCNFRRSPLV